jgi:polyisoprenoid-binding protein YceI
MVHVANFECGNGTMNSHMRKALKAETKPHVILNMTSYTVNASSVTINGTLEIAGKENPVTIPAVGSIGNGVVNVKGKYVIKMTDYGIKPPSLMMGAMKVGNNVTIDFDLTLKQ